MPDKIPTLHSLKAFNVGHHVGEPALKIETLEGVEFLVQMPPQAAIDLGRALLARGEESQKQSRN